MALTVSDRPRFSGDGQWLAAALHAEQAQLLEVTPNREYRTLVSSAGAGVGAPNLGDMSPDGRLLAVGMEAGARLWDLRSGRELAALPAGTIYVSFEGGGPPAGPSAYPRALLTGGSAGLWRWPVTADDPEAKRLRLGPPQQLSPLHRAWFARTPDGRTLAAVTEQGGANKILDLETGAVRRELGSHPDGEVKALSRDGRWAASSGWHSDRVRLHSARTGERVHEWIVGKRSYVFFTPDSRALVIARDGEFSFWDVETLQPIRRVPRDVAQFPGHVAFSPDGKLMTLEMAPGVIHLKEVATGRTVARLEDPHGDRASWHGFTPDGTQLVVVSGYASAIHIWDLRAIRMRLKEINLDWDWPEFPPAGQPQSPPADPPKISVVGAERHDWIAWRDRGKTHSDALRWDEAIADLSKAIDLNPDDPDSWNARGYAHRQLAQKEKALADYIRASELNPKEARYWRNRGSVHVEVGRPDKAVADYSKAIELEPDAAALWSGRGIAHGHLGQWGEALADYTKAVDLKPADVSYRRNQGFAWAQLGQWEKAAAAVQHATTLKPDDPEAWYYLALLPLQRDDRAEYRKTCSRMLERFGQYANGHEAYWTTWACVLTPDAIAEWPRLLKLAQRAHDDDTNNADKIRHVGAVLYRAGRFHEAVERLTSADAAYKQTPSAQIPMVYTWLFLAMAHHRLGHAAEAASWLKKAVKEIDEPSPEMAQDATTKKWNRRLTLRLLRREAEELMGKKDQ
jgi:tetratricopeptide (TPR) repeat protein/WD40 repeat protein